METYEKKEKRQFNKYDMAIGLFYGVGIFLGIGIFFVGGFMTMSGAGWGETHSDIPEVVFGADSELQSLA